MKLIDYGLFEEEHVFNEDKILNQINPSPENWRRLQRNIIIAINCFNDKYI